MKRLAPTTLLAAMIIFCVLPVRAAAPAAGSLVKGSGAAVYYLGADGKRHVFMNDRVYFSWYADFSSVKNVGDSALATYPLGGLITYKPGVRLVKIQTDPKVYAVSAGGVLRWVTSESIAVALYGADWNKNVDDVSDAFFIAFKTGTDITDASQFNPSSEQSSATDIDHDLEKITPPAMSGNPAAADVTFTVNFVGTKTPISPYIYGINWEGDYANRTDLPPVTFVRYGGNRYTTYNWENNFSNAGADWNNSSDNYLSMNEDQATATHPGEHMRLAVERGHVKKWATDLTMPIIDWLPADADGNVSCSATGKSGVSDSCAAQPSRWVANRLTKSSTLSLTPDLTDKTVYQDEFVNFIQKTFPDAQSNAAGPVMYSLDNEPALWPATHPLAHPGATTYAEMVTRTLAAGRMIKSLAPDATVFGPVSYGWNEFINLQNAPDANGTFLDVYLDALHKEEQTNGKRLVDVLDVHWYPEAKGGGTRITDENDPNPAAAVVDARVQAPRSLWDPTYRETSWITDDYLNGPIALIPWLKQRVAQHYPGTKLAITEYNYGGGSNISGGVAEADVLGIFGREGLYAAAHWNLGAFDFVWGALRMYLNYDGAGSKVGSLSVPSATTDNAKTSVYAFSDPNDPNSLQAVAINKTSAPLNVNLNLSGASGFTSADAYRLTAASSLPQSAGSIAVTGGNAVSMQLPPMSVTVLRFKR